MDEPASHTQPSPVPVFIGYSHQDAPWLKRLRVQLKPLEQAGAIAAWDDTHILASSDREQEFEQAIDRAGAAVLLISANFLASDTIAERVLPRLLARVREKNLPLLLVSVSAALIEMSPLQGLSLVNPEPDKALSVLSWGQAEAVLHETVKQVCAALGLPVPAAPAVQPALVWARWHRPQALGLGLLALLVAGAGLYALGDGLREARFALLGLSAPRLDTFAPALLGTGLWALAKLLWYALIAGFAVPPFALFMPWLGLGLAALVVRSVQARRSASARMLLALGFAVVIAGLATLILLELVAVRDVVAAPACDGDAPGQPSGLGRQVCRWLTATQSHDALAARIQLAGLCPWSALFLGLLLQAAVRTARRLRTAGQRLQSRLVWAVALAYLGLLGGLGYVTPRAAAIALYGLEYPRLHSAACTQALPRCNIYDLASTHEPWGPPLLHMCCARDDQEIAPLEQLPPAALAACPPKTTETERETIDCAIR